MIAKKYRFHGHGSLRYVYKHGQVVRSKHFAIKYSHNPKRKNSRLSVVVGKKVLKSAVKRNRIRRRLFEVLRKNWDTVPSHSDIVLTVYTADILVISNTDLETTILDSLSKISSSKQ